VETRFLGRESCSAGGNWAFAPIIDIDCIFRNPITNTRTPGADPERDCRMGMNYVKVTEPKYILEMARRCCFVFTPLAFSSQAKRSAHFP
jgi:hypothetical protein